MYSNKSTRNKNTLYNVYILKKETWGFNDDKRIRKVIEMKNKLK